MQLDLNKLSKEQIDLIIDRLCNKFDNYPLEEIDKVSNFIKYYRIKRFESGLVKILEGDEILKGIVFGVSKKKENQVIQKKENDANFTNIQNDNEKNIPEDIYKPDTNNIDKENVLKNRISKINKFRAASIGQDISSNETKNNNIILEDNIEQIESKFSLREINSQLPSENLLDRYNFGYVNLRDDEDGIPKESILGAKTRKDILRIKNQK